MRIGLPRAETLQGGSFRALVVVSVCSPGPAHCMQISLYTYKHTCIRRYCFTGLLVHTYIHTYVRTHTTHTHRRTRAVPNSGFQNILLSIHELECELSCLHPTGWWTGTWKEMTGRWVKSIHPSISLSPLYQTLLVVWHTQGTHTPFTLSLTHWVIIVSYLLFLEGKRKFYVLWV